MVLDGLDEKPVDLWIEVTNRSLGLGSIRWSQVWPGTGKRADDSGKLSAKVFDQGSVANWLLGGLAMATVWGKTNNAKKNSAGLRTCRAHQVMIMSGDHYLPFGLLRKICKELCR